MRQRGALEFGTIATLTTGSTDGAWTYLGRPQSRFSIGCYFTVGTSGTVVLQGAFASSSGTSPYLSTAAGQITLCTADNTTQVAWTGSTSILVPWVRARATAISTGGTSSGGGSTSAIYVQLLGDPA